MHHEAWLTLALAWVSAREYESLRQRFGKAEDIVRQPAAALRAAGLAEAKAAAVANPAPGALATALEWLEADRHHLLPCDADRTPALLREISAAPLLLYVNGDLDALHAPALAIVGSRNPTQGGVRNARDFAGHLGKSGFTIVSGLAQGIDAAAHRGALDAGAATVAVLGHGIDRVYPAANRELAHAIAAGGALLSEYPHGAPPDKRHFPERNRLISGLSLGVLVVEAARRSGTLITARLAAEQGREVFALPGSIHNPLARGCHELIRQGARLVETSADVVAELGALAGTLQETAAPTAGQRSAATPASAQQDDGDYRKLRAALSHDPVSLDELEAASGLTIEQLSSMLLILELQGEVEAVSGSRYTLSG